MNNNAKALKSGIWYTAANFLSKGISIITIPLFINLLTKDEFGAQGNYFAALQIFTILITLNLESTFISARFDFEKDFDSYATTMFIVSSISAVIWIVILNLFSGIVTERLHIDREYINCMCLYLLFLPAVNLYQTKERYRFGYKKSVLVSCLISVGTVLVSVILILTMSNKLSGRIWGSALPTIIIGIVLAILLIKAGRNIKFEYVKYAIPLCLPFLPHLLSMVLLNSLDKLMITDICGEEKNALYTLPYQCSTVVVILVTSMNTAFAPWLGEKLHENSYSEICSVAKKYVLVFIYFAIGIMLISPDIITIMGTGKKDYMEAKYVMPPVMLGCICQFIYTMYVNVEQFKKKIIGMSIASVSAAVLNYVLNYIFIHKYGYIAAAYTTFVCYLWLLMAHMFLVYRLGYSKVYPNKFMIAIVGISAVATVGINFLFELTVIRYIFVALYSLIFIYAVFKYKDQIMKLIKRKSAN